MNNSDATPRGHSPAEIRPEELVKVFSTSENVKLALAVVSRVRKLGRCVVAARGKGGVHRTLQMLATVKYILHDREAFPVEMFPSVASKLGGAASTINKEFLVFVCQADDLIELRPRDKQGRPQFPTPVIVDSATSHVELAETIVTAATRGKRVVLRCRGGSAVRRALQGVTLARKDVMQGCVRDLCILPEYGRVRVKEKVEALLGIDIYVVPTPAKAAV